jgi:glyoxylase-like metal-dependent hydrolase (beta-lactamase superfamily II)
MPPRTVKVGELELVPILDAIGVLGELGALYPEVPAADWEPYRAHYPELFACGSWVLRCAAFLVRTGDTTVLVDAGVGPPGLWTAWGAEWEGALPSLLDDLGVGRDDVDVVLLTHLHVDHVGWNTDEGGNVFFPRARYLVHEDALAFALTQAERPHVRRCIAPLVDRFEKVVDGFEVAPGLTTFAAPGHFPGHLGLRLRSAGEDAVLLADTAVHPALLDRPDWVYAADGDSPVCAETRRALLPELLDRDVLVACGHYPGSGIGRVVTRDGRVVWEEAR